MLGRERALEVCASALGLCRADQAEVVLMGEDLYLTRFAANHIHQNVGESNCQVRVRAVCGKRCGSAAAALAGQEQLSGVVRRATEIALLQPENPDWCSLPAPTGAPCAATVFDAATAECPPGQRAEGVAAIVRTARAVGLQAAGSFSTGVMELAVANSLGIMAYAATTAADLTVVVSGGCGSGYGDQSASAVGMIDPAAVGERAARKAAAAQNPAPLGPGEYTVILEPPAVADMLTYLGFLGFGALAVEEGRSFVAGRLGSKVMAETVSIWDDGTDPAGRPVPFDFEGVPKTKVPLIENGVARGVVYDSATAARVGKESTGHALPAPNVHGPMPLNLFMAPGDVTLEEMVASTGRGVLVTRFHYTNPVHPVRTVITGMTRDGTYLIEDGKIVRPVKNLRFTESIVRALSHVVQVGGERKFQAGYFGGALVPAIKVEGFTFTGATAH